MALRDAYMKIPSHDGFCDWVRYEGQKPCDCYVADDWEELEKVLLAAAERAKPSFEPGDRQNSLTREAVNDFLQNLKREISVTPHRELDYECRCACHSLGENYPCENPNCKPTEETPVKT